MDKHLGNSICLNVDAADTNMQASEQATNSVLVRSVHAQQPKPPSVPATKRAGDSRACVTAEAIKRAGEKRANAIARANSGAVPEPELLEQQQASSPLWVYEPVGQLVSCSVAAAAAADVFAR
eukprot:scaffold21070_cov18-Tisochrysis_lutea.AAC.1